MADDLPPNSPRPAARLLDELESIKGALEHESDADLGALADIPLLDDLVVEHLDDNAALLGNDNASCGDNGLLDLDRIFGGENAEAKTVIDATAMAFPRFRLDVEVSDADDGSAMKSASNETAKLGVCPNYTREALIQELIDEFIPKIEAELHTRLRQLDAAILRRLLNSK